MSKVLIIDDEDGLVDIIKMILSHRGFEAIGVSNPQEALAFVRREQPDVLLLDVVMPALNGWQVLNQLEQEPETAGIPTIIMSALPPEEAQHQALVSSGAVRYQAKPFDLEEVIGMVEETLRLQCEDRGLRHKLHRLREQAGLGR